MKIAQVVCAYPPYSGGIGNSAQKIQKILEPHHHSTVFTIKNKGELKEENNIIRINGKPRLGHGAILWPLLKKLKNYDYIYLHYPFFGTSFLVYLFKILNPQKKLIIHYHMDVKQQNIIYQILSWPEKLIRNSLFKKADTIISASLDYIKHSQIKNFYQKNPDKFQEIPFSINTNIFKTSENEKKDKTILFVGGLDKAHYFKGVDILIKALSQIKNLDWNLKIIGQGELKKDFIKLATDLKIINRSEFLGQLSLEELIKNYQSARVLVLPSINSNEAFGIVLIEALACGTPVIASDLPGVRAVFEDGVSGLLSQSGNISDLKEKIKIILEDDELHQKMSQAARRLALEKYDDNIVNKKILELFK